MKKLKKYMIIQSPYNGSKAVWEYIDDVKEARKYWYVAQAIDKYGVESTMPIVMNPLGGYHTHKPDAPDVAGFIEAVDWPSLKVWEYYPKDRPDFKTGWISPAGVTFTCDVFDHMDCAIALCEQYYGENLKALADEYLLKHGWFRCSNKKYTGSTRLMTDIQAKYFLDNNFKSNFDYEEIK